MAPEFEIPFARLVGLQEHVQPDDYLLDGAACTIGRSALCDIVVQGNTVSRLHARIEREGPRYVLHDAGSANGTFVNGQLIQQPHLLGNRDSIGLGNATAVLRFVDPDPTLVTTLRLRYDEQTMVFSLADQTIDLTPNQFKLMLYLYQHQGEVCTREACAEAIWGASYAPGMDADTLDRVVSNVRGVLRTIDPEANLIETRRGLGYVLVAAAG